MGSGRRAGGAWRPLSGPGALRAEGRDAWLPAPPGANGKESSSGPKPRGEVAGHKGWGSGPGSCSLLQCAGWSPNSGGSIGAGLTSAPTNDHSASGPPAPPRRRGESAWGWVVVEEIRFRSALINFLFNVTRPHCGRGKHVTQAINCDYGASGRLRVLGTRRTRASRSETGRPDRSRSRLGAAER